MHLQYPATPFILYPVKTHYITRSLEKELHKRLLQFPAVGLLGPRQCGKSTLAKHILKNYDALYLDLELPSDLNKLTDAESFLLANRRKLVCIDEIQRKPELFPLLRALCDKTGQPGQFLALGSASPDLLQQTSETLAGRIAYLDLTPFLIHELDASQERTLWFRGGFPDSLLAPSHEASLIWRRNFIRTFLERDLAVFQFGASMQTMQRLWTMLAHSNGQLLNASKLAESLGVTSPTVHRYLDFLEHTYMVRRLLPWFSNTKKRLIKSPKVFVRDTGLLHALLDIETPNQLFGHPGYGSSWECYVISQLLGAAPDWRHFFYRTANGNEIDLILQKGARRLAIECKASASPQVSAGFYNAMDDLGIERGYVVAPLHDGQGYPLNDRVEVMTPTLLIHRLTRDNCRKNGSAAVE